MQNLYRILNFLISDPKYLYQKAFQRIFQQVNIYCLNRSFILKTLWIPLTYRCNLSCVMCGQWGREGRSKNFESEKIIEELPLQTLKDLIDNVAKFNPKIVLVGGEPFLYNDWYSIAKYIKEKKCRCEITTNGILLQKYYESVKDVFDAINISIDGDRETNDNIRKLKGCFDIVIDGIKKIQNAKKTKKPYINICCTISEENYCKLEKLPETLEQEQIKIDTLLFQNLEFIDEKILQDVKKIWREKLNIDENYWYCLCRKSQNIKSDILAQQINKIKKMKTKNIKFIIFEPDFSDEEIHNYYSNPQNIKRFKNMCIAPWTEVFVYPDGNVWTCPGMIMGNIKNNKFTDIWNNKKYLLLRETLKKIKTFPVCFRCANHWHNWSN